MCLWVDAVRFLGENSTYSGSSRERFSSVLYVFNGRIRFLVVKEIIVLINIIYN